ncbi:tRNA (guanosine(46)-N7)-methyltransferase TrmB [bacterium]|nr:tRNA (guanosine(46)-N7)-methyltransferase TrmB [bacterium]
MNTYIIDWHQEEVKRLIQEGVPVDWQDVFENKYPLDLEIGIGNGSFLVPFAKDHPNRNMVGIEIEGVYLKKANKKLIKQALSNARLLIGDAKFLTWKLFADESIEDVYINYPDPWFKKRHKKRRLINPISLRLLALKMRSILTIATDDEEYRDWVIASIKETQCFEPLLPKIFVTELENYYPTKYEKKWKDQGKQVFYLKFRKNRNPEIDWAEYIETQNLQFTLKKVMGHHHKMKSAKS